MEKNLKALNRNLILTAVKTILFITPIFIITDNIYKWKYGCDYLTLKINYILNFTIYFPSKLIFPLLIFSIIFLFSYFLEKDILPSIILLWDGKIKIQNIRKAKINTNFILKKIRGFNPWLYINKDVTIKNKVYSELMFLPVTMVLWLLSINSILSYISIIPVIILTIYLYKILNTAFYENSK
jgi:hypothetical protein